MEKRIYVDLIGELPLVIIIKNQKAFFLSGRQMEFVQIMKICNA